MITTTAIGRWVSETLLADEAVTAIVGQRVYPLVTDEEPALPWTVFTSLHLDYETTKDGSTPVGGGFEMVVAAASYARSVDLTDAVVEALNNKVCAEIDGEAIVTVVSIEATYDAAVGYLHKITYVIDI